LKALYQRIPTLRLLPSDPNITFMQANLLDESVSVSDHIHFTHRLVSLVLELGLNQLPVDDKSVITPSGGTYEGKVWGEKICAATVMRSGEPMEKELRKICKAIIVGHILIQYEPAADSQAKVYYSSVNTIVDVERRWVLLLDAIIHSGSTIIRAISELGEHGVAAEKIIVVSIFAADNGLEAIKKAYPTVKMVTSAVTKGDTKIDISRKYFGA